MPKEDLVKGRLAPQWWPTAGIALATPFLVWFAIGEPPTYAIYRFGPYDIGQQAGHIASIVAAIAAAASVAVLVIRTRRGVTDLRSWAVAVFLASAGALGAAGWRGVTSSYSGADIGGPVVVLLVPLLIAGLLVGAAWIADAGGRVRRRRTWSLTLAAAMVAPVLYAVMYALSV